MKIKILVSAVFSLVTIYAIIYVFMIYNDTFSSQAIKRIAPLYSMSLQQDIWDRWQCLSKSEQEPFIFKVMERFAPRDKHTIDTGRILKNEMEQKKLQGTLTVAERERLESGYYDTNEISKLNGNFSPPRCKEDMKALNRYPFYTTMPEEKLEEVCKLPYIQVSYDEDDRKIKIIYEDKYSRWTYNTFFMDQEYEKLTWSKRIDIRKKIMLNIFYSDDLKERAKATVNNMPATALASKDVERHTHDIYKKLVCDEKAKQIIEW